jgi:hypothetical protein
MQLKRLQLRVSIKHMPKYALPLSLLLSSDAASSTYLTSIQL